MLQWKSKKSFHQVAGIVALMALLTTSHAIEGAENPTTQKASEAKKSGDTLIPVTPKDVKGNEGATEAKIGVVNFRKVVENSKLGKQQQATFEGMKSQMESLLQEKEKSLKEFANKLNDADYVDGLTPDAENELKFKYRSLSQEMAQAQQQFLQTLQQANVKIIQMLTEEVAKVATEIAQAQHFDLVLNEDSAFFAKPSFDLSDRIVQKMDENFERDAKKREVATPAPQKNQ